MSSDEEETVGAGVQYRVRVPAWRSEVVTGWLRIFDILYVHARRGGVFGDQRGSQARQRIGPHEESSRRAVIPKLPRNAYSDDWFNAQVGAEMLVRPGPPAQYTHDTRTLE
jgi:hypothetical protein